jgi:hypothetical protein
MISEERKRKMKKSLLLLGIFLSIGIFQSCGVSSLKATPNFTYTPSILVDNRNTITRQSSEYPTGKPDPTGQLLESGWYRFINYEARYYIDYPPMATLHVEPQGKIMLSMAEITFPREIDPNGVVMKVFTYLFEQNMSLEKFAEEEIDHIWETISPEYIGNINKYSTVISGHQAIVVETTGFWRINVFIGADEMYYSLFLAPSMLAAEGTTNEAVGLFRNILDSFTLFGY